jgi:hypothetical protein
MRGIGNIIWAVVLIAIVFVTYGWIYLTYHQPPAEPSTNTQYYEVTEWVDDIDEHRREPEYYPADNVNIFQEGDNCVKIERAYQVLYFHCGKVTVKLVER